MNWMASNVPAITDNLNNIMSGYATFSYSYKYFFTGNVNARVDGSNAFGDRSNEKFSPIWSVSPSTTSRNILSCAACAGLTTST